LLLRSASPVAAAGISGTMIHFCSVNQAGRIAQLCVGAPLMCATFFVVLVVTKGCPEQMSNVLASTRTRVIRKLFYTPRAKHWCFGGVERCGHRNFSVAISKLCRIARTVWAKDPRMFDWTSRVRSTNHRATVSACEATECHQVRWTEGWAKDSARPRNICSGKIAPILRHIDLVFPPTPCPLRTSRDLLRWAGPLLHLIVAYREVTGGIHLRKSDSYENGA